MSDLMLTTTKCSTKNKLQIQLPAIVHHCVAICACIYGLTNFYFGFFSTILYYNRAPQNKFHILIYMHCTMHITGYLAHLSVFQVWRVLYQSQLYPVYGPGSSSPFSALLFSSLPSPPHWCWDQQYPSASQQQPAHTKKYTHRLISHTPHTYPVSTIHHSPLRAILSISASLPSSVGWEWEGWEGN